MLVVVVVVPSSSSSSSSSFVCVLVPFSVASPLSEWQ
jgi:hypothetical protein